MWNIPWSFDGVCGVVFNSRPKSRGEFKSMQNGWSCSNECAEASEVQTSAGEGQREFNKGVGGVQTSAQRPEVSSQAHAKARGV